MSARAVCDCGWRSKATTLGRAEWLARRHGDRCRPQRWRLDDLVAEWEWIGRPHVQVAAPRLGLEPRSLARALERAKAKGLVPRGAFIGSWRGVA